MPKETKEVLLKKVERIKTLLVDLDRLLDGPIDFSESDQTSLLAAQRIFELMVELASDINTSLILDKIGKTPDSYREAFSGLSKLGAEEEITNPLVNSAKLRNILIHEYDFEIDDAKFYQSAKSMIPAYKKYIGFIHNYLEKS